MQTSYRWVILAVGVIAQASFSAVTLGLPSVAAVLRASYGLSIQQVGVAIGAAVAGMVLTMLGWGALADRFGERAVMTVGLLGAAGMLAAAARAGGFAAVAGTLAAAGAFGASVNAASGRAVMAWFGPAERGLAMGVRQTALPLGGALASVLLPAVGGRDSGGRVFAVLAAGCLLGAVVVAVGMRGAPEATDRDRRRAGADAGPPAPHPARDPRIWRLAAGSLLLVLPQVGLIGFTALYLHDARGLSPAAAGGVLAAVQAGGCVARVAMGVLADRRRTRLALLRGVALALAGALVLAAAVLRAPVPVTAAALVVAGVLGLSWNGLAFLATAEAAPATRRGTALGVQNTVVVFGGAAAPVGFAAVVGAFGYGWAFAVLPAAPLLAVAVLAPLTRAERAAAGSARPARDVTTAAT